MFGRTTPSLATSAMTSFLLLILCCVAAIAIYHRVSKRLFQQRCKDGVCQDHAPSSPLIGSSITGSVHQQLKSRSLLSTGAANRSHSSKGRRIRAALKLQKEAPKSISSQLPDKIDSAAAAAAFQSQQDVLLVAICSCLTTLANKLFTNFVITSEALEKACNERNGSRERAAYLLSSVQDRIKTEPADFVKVVDILESEPTLTRQARQLVDIYCNPSPISSAAAINNAISRFSAELKAKYRCSRIKSDKWPPTPSKEYVKLTVVEYHSTYREDYIARVLKGKINKVPKAQDLTEEQILDLCVKQVGKGKVIVIEGAPGIGKSTLAWELCRKWEECSKMKAYSLVILLRASEKRVQNISGVSSLFYAYDRADRTSLVEEIRNHQGSGVMFVLDGFDELPRSLQHEGILADLLQKNVLSKSTVLITTRSSAMDRLLTISEPVIEKHIVILGFSQESMEAYASNAFSCTDELKRFRDYISGSPAIDSLMYVPLYAAFIVMIYKSTTSRKTLPRTITQLYTQLCLTILNRYMKTGSKYSSVRISSLESIPCEFREQFLELSKLAYESFIMEVVSFYSDISEHFGFLDAVPDLYGGCNVSFNFLHLTLQEFFAAYHITNMSDSGVELFNIRGKEERWNVVWRFVAGLKGFKFLDASTDATCLMQDRQLSLFFIQCLFEAQSVKLDFQSTFGFRAMQCALELCTSLDYYTLGYCIANCTTAESSWELTLYLPLVCSVSAFTQGLMSCNFSSGVISSLYIFCQFQPDVLGFLQECVSAATSPLHRVTQFGIFAADLTSNKEKTCLYELISHMPHLHTLGISFSRFSSLQGSPLIYYPCRDTDGLLKLLHCLPHSKVTSLNCIDSGLEYFLEESPLAQDYCTAFQALINPPSNIKVLFIGDSSFLNFNYCRAGNQTLCSLVSSSSSLKTLTLGLTHDCSFLNAFNSNKHLTKLAIVHVDLQWPRFSLAGEKWTKLVPGILKILQRCTGLEVLTLKLFDNSPKDKNVLRTIANALQRSKSLKSLQVEVLEGDRQLEKTLQAIDQRISVKDGLEEIYFGLLS